MIQEIFIIWKELNLNRDGRRVSNLSRDWTVYNAFYKTNLNSASGEIQIAICWALPLPTSLVYKTWQYVVKSITNIPTK